MSLFDGVFGAGTQSALLGTSEDELYRQHMDHLRAHEDEMRRQKYAMQAQMLQSQMQQAQIANAPSMLKSAYGQAIKGQSKPFNPNEDAAYTTPLSQLVTLWQANYGDKWVEVFEDDFWNSARVRLHNNDKLEGVGGWYRIKEDA